MKYNITIVSNIFCLSGNFILSFLLKDVGNWFGGFVSERKLFVVFHVFLTSLLYWLLYNSKYTCFAARMFLFSIPLNVFR